MVLLYFCKAASEPSGSLGYSHNRWRTGFVMTSHAELSWGALQFVALCIPRVSQHAKKINAQHGIFNSLSFEEPPLHSSAIVNTAQ